MNISANFSAGIQEKKYPLPSYPLPAPGQSTKPSETKNNNKKIIAALGALAAAGAAAVAIAVSLKKGKAPDIETSDVAKATQKLSPEKKELLTEYQNLYNNYLAACGPERNEITSKYYVKLDEIIEHMLPPEIIKKGIEGYGDIEKAPLFTASTHQYLSSDIKALNKKLNDNIDAPKSFNDIIDWLKEIHVVEDISELPDEKIKESISGIKKSIERESFYTEKRKKVLEPFIQSVQEELTNKFNILKNPPKDMSLDSYAATYEEVYNSLQNLRTKTYNALEEFKKSYQSSN